MLTDFIKKLLDKKPLSGQEARVAFDAIMDGKETGLAIAAFLTALRFCGETTEIVYGAAEAIRKRARQVRVDSGIIADTCGTGGDYARTFNISTVAAVVVAACGIPVAKHGNRCVSSQSGSADVLECAGMKIEIEPEKAERMIRDCGFAFLFAPAYHPAMKQVAGVRKELGFRTIFNILGPLCNPAGANVQLLGVGSMALLDIIPMVLHQLGIQRAWVVFGEDGLDELSVAGKTYIVDVERQLRRFEISPEDAGLKRASLKDLAGGTPRENVMILKEILSGKDRGPKRDAVLLNAGAVILIAGKASNLKEAMAMADDAIKKGKASALFDRIVELSNAP
jgi:anthranilate phosphoribosyltransferase